MRPQSALRSQAASVSSSPIDPTQRWYSAFFADWSCRNGRNATPGTSSWMDDGESIKRGAGSTSLGQKVYGGKGTAIFEGRPGGLVAMHDVLRDRLWRKMEALSEQQIYQV